jgi:maltooligosyltrehalose synthase
VAARTVTTSPTSRAIQFRRTRQALFAEGDYLPRTARGQKENYLIAFARASANQTNE